MTSHTFQGAGTLHHKLHTATMGPGEVPCNCPVHGCGSSESISCGICSQVFIHISTSMVQTLPGCQHTLPALPHATSAIELQPQYTCVETFYAFLPHLLPCTPSCPRRRGCWTSVHTTRRCCITRSERLQAGLAPAHASRCRMRRQVGHSRTGTRDERGWAKPTCYDPVGVTTSI